MVVDPIVRRWVNNARRRTITAIGFVVVVVVVVCVVAVVVVVVVCVVAVVVVVVVAVVVVLVVDSTNLLRGRGKVMHSDELLGVIGTQEHGGLSWS